MVKSDRETLARLGWEVTIDEVDINGARYVRATGTKSFSGCAVSEAAAIHALLWMITQPRVVDGELLALGLTKADTAAGTPARDAEGGA